LRSIRKERARLNLSETRGLDHGMIDSRRTQPTSVQDGTLATAVGQILSKSRAFAVSSRAASTSFSKLIFIV
jgi:hypothetical protein